MTSTITLPWWFYIFKYEVCNIIPVNEQDIELLPSQSVVGIKSQKQVEFTIDDTDFGIEKKIEPESVTEPRPVVTNYRFEKESDDDENDDDENVIIYSD